MARAITREEHGVRRTMILGPGDYRAGAFDATPPLDPDPESVREAEETDEQLREHWLRLLERYEGELADRLVRGDDAGAEQLRAAIERSAHAQLAIATLRETARRLAALPGAPPAAVLRSLLLGGRDERTVRAWQEGRTLVPEGAMLYLGRIENVDLARGEGERLKLTVTIDASPD